MSRLIDADKLIERFDSRKMYTGALIKEFIDMQSTAYYPKYVLEELEEKAEMISIPHNSFVEKIVVIRVNEAIKIVKRGGIDE